VTTDFDAHLTVWRDWAGAPWGRIRFAVVAAAVRGVIAGTGPLQVLDVGGGDGRDALPLAAAGHRVTVLDPAPGMLAEGRARARAAGADVTFIPGSLDGPLPDGPFDLVLCHFVLQYRPDPDADLDRLLSLCRPGGLISVVAPNPDGSVLPALVRHGVPAARTQLDARTGATATFNAEVALLRSDRVEDHLTASGCSVVGRFGGRIANDLLTDEAAKHDPARYAELEAFEIELSAREPFRRIGQFWQLIVRSPGG